MQQPESVIDRILVSWVNPWIPALWRESESENARKARGLVIVTAVASALCLYGGLSFSFNGVYGRGAYLLFSILPLCSSLIILHKTERVEPATHWLCGYSMLTTIVMTQLSGGVFSVYSGVLAIPVAATAVAGSRVGFLWTVLVVGMLAFIGTFVSPTPADEVVAWNAMIGASIVGSALVVTESARERNLLAAREAANAALVGERSRFVAEKALAESQNLFATAFNLAPSILALSVAETGELLDVNESFVRLLGFEREEVIGSNLVELGVWSSQGSREAFIAAVSPDERSEGEVRLKTRSGDELWLLASAAVLEIEGRRCLLCQGIDITERKRADEQLERQRQELESRVVERGEELRESRLRLRESERLAAVGTLAAGIAHQINNPIGGIAAATEYALMVDKEEEGDTIRRQALETALEEARRCGRIVKSMLKFARDEPTPKWVEDVGATVRRAAELTRAYVEGLGGSLEIDTPTSVLPALISPIDIDQIVVNLIRNGAESKTSGGANVVVIVSCDEDAIEIAIEDDGQGIDPKDRSRIFDPFYTTRLEDGGSGLGLSVVHGIVVDHAGSLEIEERAGGGTRFVIRLARSNESLH